MSDAQHIEYIAVEEFAREGKIAAVTNWMSHHPALAGSVVGTIAVLIAVANAYEGVMNAPGIALIISLIAVGTWVLFFYMASPVLARLAVREEDFRRELVFDEDRFEWHERNEPRIAISEPSYELYGAEVTDEDASSSKRHRPVSAWLVIRGEGQRFVLRTQLTAEEAYRYPTPSNDIVENTDEELPTTLVSDLLSMAGRELEDEPKRDEDAAG